MTSGESPIFVVGPPRSGTELARSILNRHSNIFISAETHYFDDLRPRLPQGKLAEPDRDLALRYYSSLNAATYGFESALTPSEAAGDEMFRPLPRTLGGDADAFFVAHCRSQAAACGKTIWGEKTPRHVFQASAIFEAFPDARILAMARDPRGVTASYRDWSQRWLRQEQVKTFSPVSIGREQARVRMSYSLTILALLWRSAVNTALQLQRERGAGRILVCRFEDLLTRPEGTVRQIADWIGVDYEPNMLNVGVVNSSYAEPEPGQAFDREIADRWRAKLSSDEISYIDWLTAKTASRLGYEKSNFRLSPGFALRQLLSVPASTIRAAAANRHRIGRIGAFLAARLGGLFK